MSAFGNFLTLNDVRMSRRLIKPFEAIPGPKSYSIVGTLPYYLPGVGKYRFDELPKNGLKKYREFGPVVKEEIVPGTNVIWIFKPEDVQELFRKEGRYPQRRSHLALNHYRTSRKDLYNTGGLLPTNGPEWYRLRRTFQKGLSSPRNVKSYLPLVNEVVDEFAEHIRKRPKDQDDFLPDLSRVFLEMLGLVAFDLRLNSFSSEELMPGSRCSKLMASALTINSCILETDNGLRLWRFVDTPLYKKLKTAHEYLESVAVALVKEKVEKMKIMTPSDKEPSLLESYLTAPEVDFKDVIGMSSDMLLAGIDTITYSTGFLLYHLASNQEQQNKLFKESQELLPKPTSPVTAEVLSKAEYLKSALKESLRMNPVSVGVGRVLAEDAVFSGYQVPKENIVVTQNQVVCKMEEYFSEAQLYRPERWLKRHEEQKNINPYLVLPFGHGPRTCIARRLAEQNMQTLMLKLCRQFQILWTGGSLGTKSYLINKPDGPLKLSFKTRTS